MASQKEVAKWLGMSDRNFRNLAHIFPDKKPRVGYDLQECVLVYIRFLQKNQKKGQKLMVPGDDYDPENPEESGGINLASEEQRYSKLRNDKLELQINELARKLAPVELLEEYAGKLAGAVGKILDGVVGQVKRRNPRLKTNELAAIAEEVNKAMNAASRITIDIDQYQGLSEGDS